MSVQTASRLGTTAGAPLPGPGVLLVSLTTLSALLFCGAVSAVMLALLLAAWLVRFSSTRLLTG
ncbi:hypothetical protein [Thermogemmatispora sp.]|uniref:hypothetical protein n=1 Tax=Thermogemmatispora sp. TaxID=1968838 RepID=UPI001D27078B|nr:hypothetical protein [Thermogemmatispora sp.]MBX5451805.1 hypothetical protein [Thermogemmatispora sp.]